MTDTLQEGIHFYINGKYREALTVLLSLDVSDDDENSLEVAYYTGLSYSKLKRYEDAVLYLEQVVTATSNEKRLEQCRLALMVIYTMTGRNQLAEYEINELLENGNESCATYCARAFMNWEQKKYKETVENYEKALDINPDSPTALNGLGYVLACQDQDLTRALSLCKRAVDLVPNSAAALDSLGWVYYMLGLDAEAKTYCTRARSFNENNTEINEHYMLLVKGISIS